MQNVYLMEIIITFGNEVAKIVASAYYIRPGLSGLFQQAFCSQYVSDTLVEDVLDFCQAAHTLPDLCGQVLQLRWSGGHLHLQNFIGHSLDAFQVRSIFCRTR